MKKKTHQNSEFGSHSAGSPDSRGNCAPHLASERYLPLLTKTGSLTTAGAAWAGAG